MSQYDYVGKRFIARRRFSFIDKDVQPGEEFVFTERYADMGIQPEFWLAHGKVTLLPDPTPEPDPTPDPTPETPPEPVAEPTPRRKRGGPPPVPDGSSTAADATEPAAWPWEGRDD